MAFTVAARLSLASSSLGQRLFSTASVVRSRPGFVARSSRRTVCLAAMAEIKVGDAVPSAKVNVIKGTDDKVEMDFAEICAGKKVVVFAVPGEWTMS